MNPRSRFQADAGYVKTEANASEESQGSAPRRAKCANDAGRPNDEHF